MEDNVKMPANVVQFYDTTMQMAALYERKNKDYGNSFHELFEEDGLAISRIKITDKYKRFKELSKGEAPAVEGESLEDTLIDLANYAVMTLMEIRNAQRP